MLTLEYRELDAKVVETAMKRGEAVTVNISGWRAPLARRYLRRYERVRSKRYRASDALVAAGYQLLLLRLGTLLAHAELNASRYVITSFQTPNGVGVTATPR